MVEQLLIFFLLRTSVLGLDVKEQHTVSAVMDMLGILAGRHLQVVLWTAVCLDRDYRLGVGNYRVVICCSAQSEQSNACQVNTKYFVHYYLSLTLIYEEGSHLSF